VVAQVLAHTQLLELSTNVGQLLKDVLVKLLKVVLEHVLVLRDGHAVRVVLLRWRQILPRGARHALMVPGGRQQAGASGLRTMFCSSTVWLRMGRLWMRLQRSPWRHAPILR